LPVYMNTLEHFAALILLFCLVEISALGKNIERIFQRFYPNPVLPFQFINTTNDRDVFRLFLSVFMMPLFDEQSLN
jgi:hypothetical protein